ncbi:MAG: YdjY domain-containing protein [Thermodesulfovibrionales bacterium]
MDKDQVSISRGDFLKTVGAYIFLGISSIKVFPGLFKKVIFRLAEANAYDVFQNLPTRETPLIIDEKRKRVLIYTEVNGINVRKWNNHWGIVSKDGKFQDRAILIAYANHLDFHDALLKIGAKPGNNLNKDTNGKYVEGDPLDIKATWPGLGKELTLDEIFIDEKGKKFNIRFGGNRKASEEKRTGCLTCLESCWIAISSNANYPQIGSIKRFINPNSRFKGRDDILPDDGKPVIMIYKVANGK